MNLLHLSDIHFGLALPLSNYERHAKTRNECLEAVQQFASQLSAPIDYIVLTGDLAASGDEREYDRLSAWLTEACGILGTRLGHIVMVPGNHDVNRASVKASLVDQTFHGLMRDCKSDHQRHKLWLRMMSDPTTVEELFKPVEAYNTFADQYSCVSSPELCAWSRKSAFVENVDVEFVGFNSVLLSDENDDDSKGRLYLGALQTDGVLERGVIPIALCHHPLDWLLDGAEVRRSFKRRFALQLFGHKHDWWADFMDETAILGSGALQPEDDGVTLPEFQLLQLNLHGYVLELTVHRKRWEREYGHFVTVNAPDDSAAIRKLVDVSRFLPRTKPGDLAPKDNRPVADTTAGPLQNDTEHVTTVNTFDDAAENLVFAFHTLKPSEQRAIIRDLGLADEMHVPVVGGSIRSYLESAKKQGKLGELWKRTNAALRNQVGDNPFEGS